ncbi:hypothetical protein H3H36_20475 [Duganella sp. FT3S]|uniref:Solute-binding protein family 3/N-terminal domain-containing protein n=1 Tax=Rugamonas fusca TaxID=2758568 RepID=A0A7W2EL22_9BURK|nr:hypothetical protein [Rugamonas fusca]
MPTIMTSDGQGIVDQLIRDAAREVGMEVEFRVAPTARCREEVNHDLADAFPVVPYTRLLTAIFAYPMRGQGADPARAVVRERVFVFRRVGTSVDWNGRRFSGLQTPVLVPAAAALLLDHLAVLQVPVDMSGHSPQSVFDKLLAKRADAALCWELACAMLLAKLPYADKVEMLPTPFTDELYYFGISRRFYEAHTDQVERLWDAIGHIAQSQAYKQKYRSVVDDLKKKSKR